MYQSTASLQETTALGPEKWEKRQSLVGRDLQQRATKSYSPPMLDGIEGAFYSLGYLIVEE